MAATRSRFPTDCIVASPISGTTMNASSTLPTSQNARTTPVARAGTRVSCPAEA
jgi:hypothetical protein